MSDDDVKFMLNLRPRTRLTYDPQLEVLHIIGRGEHRVSVSPEDAHAIAAVLRVELRVVMEGPPEDDDEP